MVRKIIGTVLVIISCLLIILFVIKGLIFPHLSGPILLGVAGLVLLLLKRKDKKQSVL